MGDAPLHTDIKPKEFWSAKITERFVDGLDVYPGYWQRLAANCPFRGHDFANNTFKDTDKGRASRLIFLSIIKLYPVTHLDEQSDEKSSVLFPTLPAVKGINYMLAPPSLLLVEPNPIVKTFSDKQEAVRFLSDLNMDDAQLNNLSTTIGFAAPTVTKTTTPRTKTNRTPTVSPQIAAMAQALLDGKFFLLEQQPSAKPPPRTTVNNAADPKGNNKPLTLGPHEESGSINVVRETITGLGAGTVISDDAEDVKPLCIYKKLTLSCRHGNTVTLDAMKPAVNGNVLPVLQIVSSQNEKLKDANGQPVFDILSVNADIEDVCPTHKTQFITISDSAATLTSPQSNGKSAKFKSPSKQIKIGTGSSLLKYLWLPNVENEGVKRYKVCAVQSCDFSQFDEKARCIQVEVFPYMKWALNFSVNLGSIKNDDKPDTNKLAFAGSLKLQQDNQKTDEFTADYKKKLAVFEETLSNFKNILNDNIFDKFKDGRNIDIDVSLPKIALNYDAQFKEKSGSNLVVRTHEFSFEADPFIKIAASVDILPIIVNYLSSWWSRPFNAFFEWIKQKYGEIAGKERIQADISFKVSINGSLGAKFIQKRDGNGKTINEGEPVKTKIVIKAEGEAKMDGHIYVVKVEMLLKAGVESSIEIGVSLGNDELVDRENSGVSDNDAPFVSLDFMFNGVKVYLEKEIQLSLKKKTTTSSGDSQGFFGEAVSDSLPLENGDEVAAKETERLEKVWLKMSDKHQFKYYLDAVDREYIKRQET